MRFPELGGRVALVTGGRQGIGAAVRDTLRAEGVIVVSADLGYAHDELRAEGDGLFTVRLDVSDEARVRDVVAAAWSRLGAVDILVNAAGISTMDFVVDSTTADWELTNRVNATGSYLVAREVSRRLVEAGRPGRVILVSSQAGKNGYRAMGAYVASKHAVMGLTKTLAVELAPHGVLVNAVCPGIIETDMKRRERVEGGELRGMTAGDIEREDNAQVPLGRTGQPQDVANVVLFLASDLSSYMTGQGVNVTGGMTMH